jgi:hypothetical protein
MSEPTDAPDADTQAVLDGQAWKAFCSTINEHTTGTPPHNWLTMTGLHEGTMLLRWVRAEQHPEPRRRVVPVAALEELNS